MMYSELSIAPLIRELRGEGGLVTPGFIDPHTHLLFAGDRADEFALRCKGATYQQIAQAGGGILKTVRATRQASVEELVEQGLKRLRTMLSYGTTTVEVKTGYGLTLKDELKMLDAIYQLQQLQPVELVPTFMPAHAVPPEMKADDYVEHICQEMLPAAKEHPAKPRFVDLFCEEGAFTLSQSRRLFKAALQWGFQLKIHADEFSRLGGSQLAAEWGAVSADHLLKSNPSDWEALARAGTVAVLLPGTAFFLKEPMPNAQGMKAKGVRLALGTDFNPGSCHIPSMPFMIGLACLFLGLSPEEALQAATENAAYALGLQATHGVLQPGYVEDALIWDVPTPDHIAYSMVTIKPRYVIKKGKLVWENPP